VLSNLSWSIGIVGSLPEPVFESRRDLMWRLILLWTFISGHQSASEHRCAAVDNGHARYARRAYLPYASHAPPAGLPSACPICKAVGHQPAPIWLASIPGRMLVGMAGTPK